jgi:membrane protease YdiL (CAAX protease family)
MPDTPTRSWRQHPLALLLAVLIGIGPYYGLAFWSNFSAYMTGTFTAPDIQATLINLIITFVGFGGLIWAALVLLNGERLRDLNLRPGVWWKDLLHALPLLAILVGSQMALMAWISLSGDAELPAANTEIALELAANWKLLLVWLVPVVWLQAGVIEEFSRTFMLSRFWKVWPSATGKFLALVASSLLFGLGHVYQGGLGLAGTALIGFILGGYYLIYGRVLPLIIAHGLYNTLVIVNMVLAVRYGLIGLNGIALPLL